MMSEQEAQRLLVAKQNNDEMAAKAAIASTAPSSAGTLPIAIPPQSVSTPIDPWHTFENVLYLNNALFRRGIVSIVPLSEKREWLHKISEQSIYNSGQTTDSESGQQETNTTSKQRVLSIHFVPSVNRASSTQTDPPHTHESRGLINSRKLLIELTKFANKKENGAFKIWTGNQDQFYVRSDFCRDEAFLPLSVNGKGLYLSPWFSNEKPEWNCSGFDQFVAARCLFGASLRGRNNKNRAYPFIKHEISFFDNEHITSIVYNSLKPGPYEESLLFDLQNYCELIKKLSAVERPSLYFHLPDYDYVLFGVELYLRGRITYNALDDFINIIFNKKEEFSKIIKELCQAHRITVTILSPFESLFGALPAGTKLIDAIFKALQLPIPSQPNRINERNPDTESEKHLVQTCLLKLCTNTSNPIHAKVWSDFIKSHASKNEPITTPEHLLKVGAQNICTIEDLFKIANAVVIGIASQGKPNYKTCSILPLSEKQIQLGYRQYIRDPFLRDKYSQVFNLTLLDLLLTYSAATNGPLFYFDLEAEAEILVKLIRDCKLLEVASRNIHQMICGNPQKDLKEILPFPLASSPPSYPRDLTVMSASKGKAALSPAEPLDSTNSSTPSLSNFPSLQVSPRTLGGHPYALFPPAISVVPVPTPKARSASDPTPTSASNTHELNADIPPASFTV